MNRYDDAEGQRRSDGYTFLRIDCISLREAVAELCVSCTSRSLIKCIGECLHELCVSYINTFSMLTVLVGGECGSTNCGE